MTRSVQTCVNLSEVKGSILVQEKSPGQRFPTYSLHPEDISEATPDTLLPLEAMIHPHRTPHMLSWLMFSTEQDFLQGCSWLWSAQERCSLCDKLGHSFPHLNSPLRYAVFSFLLCLTVLFINANWAFRDSGCCFHTVASPGDTVSKSMPTISISFFYLVPFG